MTSNANLLAGNLPFQARARKTYPYLIRYAKAGIRVYYSVLAKQVGISNERHFNRILDLIQSANSELRKDLKLNIPRIQDIVINKSTQLPGYYRNHSELKKLSAIEKKRFLDLELAKVHSFPKWDLVLSKLGLEPLEFVIDADLEKAKKINAFGGGESERHKSFKEWVALNPSQIGLDKHFGKGQLESKLASGDRLDVLFEIPKFKIGIEVKSDISSPEDILRGLFQCVKYKHIIEAEQVIKNEVPNCRVILVLQGQFPSRFDFVKELLEIEVLDNIINSR